LMAKRRREGGAESLSSRPYIHIYLFFFFLYSLEVTQLSYDPFGSKTQSWLLVCIESVSSCRRLCACAACWSPFWTSKDERREMETIWTYFGYARLALIGCDAVKRQTDKTDIKEKTQPLCRELIRFQWITSL
jgi:hypothetical protein